MSKTRILLLVALVTGFAFFQTAVACPLHVAKCAIITDTSASKTTITFKTDSLCAAVSLLECINPSEVPPPTDHPKKKRFVYALFALPFPCGFVGAHRVMMGTSPWVPIVYVATFGGCFGLLPLIDFCFITFSKDITPYENNPHVFMWAK
jgi:hypothetical protein